MNRITEQEARSARNGPRHLKPVESKEHAIQLIYDTKTLLESADWRLEQFEENIELARKHEHWKFWGYDSLEDYVLGELENETVGDLARYRLTKHVPPAEQMRAALELALPQLTDDEVDELRRLLA